MSVIRFEQVGRVFGQNVEALRDIDLTVGDKEFVAIVGPSGCGKTTLMRMVAGLEFPTGGRVSVDENVVTSPGPERAVVFQQFALFPWKTVAENIGFGLQAKGMARQEIKRRVERYVRMMHLEGHEGSYPSQLSGGMQQRVAIARAYALEPKVLLMDEPFGALDAQTRTIMQEDLARTCRDNPLTVLFITHAVEEAVYLADRVVVMGRRPGCIREIIDVGSTRRKEKWADDARIEDVMDRASFVHFRTQIWKMLRSSNA
jgi:NitT/TauT family transport system ATP-binding protein